MSDYFGSVLGLSSTGAIRPRVPSLYEPVGLDDDTPMIEQIPTPPALPRRIEAEHTETKGTVVPLLPAAERQRISRSGDPVVAHAEPAPRQAGWGPVIVAGQPVRPPAGLTTSRPAGAAPQPPDITNVQHNTNVLNVTNSATTTARHTHLNRQVHNSVERNSIEHNTVEHNSGNHVHNQIENRINHVHEGPQTTTHQHFAAPPPRPAQTRQRREQPSAPSEPVIRVSIGRIEVTAEPAAAAPPARRARKPRPETKSLASYLAERDGGPA